MFPLFFSFTIVAVSNLSISRQSVLMIHIVHRLYILFAEVNIANILFQNIPFEK